MRPAPPCGREVGGEALDPAAQDEVPVGHDEGGAPGGAHGIRRAEHVVDAGAAASAVAAACWMTGPSMSGSL